MSKLAPNMRGRGQPTGGGSSAQWSARSTPRSRLSIKWTPRPASAAAGAYGFGSARQSVVLASPIAHPAPSRDASRSAVPQTAHTQRSTSFFESVGAPQPQQQQSLAPPHPRRSASRGSLQDSVAGMVARPATASRVRPSTAGRARSTTSLRRPSTAGRARQPQQGQPTPAQPAQAQQGRPPRARPTSAAPQRRDGGVRPATPLDRRSMGAGPTAPLTPLAPYSPAPGGAALPSIDAFPPSPVRSPQSSPVHEPRDDAGPSPDPATYQQEHDQQPLQGADFGIAAPRSPGYEGYDEPFVYTAATAPRAHAPAYNGISTNTEDVPLSPAPAQQPRSNYTRSGGYNDQPHGARASSPVRVPGGGRVVQGSFATATLRSSTRRSRPQSAGPLRRSWSTGKARSKLVERTRRKAAAILERTHGAQSYSRLPPGHHSIPVGGGAAAARARRARGQQRRESYRSRSRSRSRDASSRRRPASASAVRRVEHPTPYDSAGAGGGNGGNGDATMDTTAAWEQRTQRPECESAAANRGGGVVSDGAGAGGNGEWRDSQQRRRPETPVDDEDIVLAASLRPQIKMRRDSDGHVWRKNAKFDFVSTMHHDFPEHPLVEHPPPKAAEWKPNPHKLEATTEASAAFLKWDIPDPPTRPPVKVPTSLKFTAVSESRAAFVAPVNAGRAAIVRREHVVRSGAFLGETEAAAQFQWDRSLAAQARGKRTAAAGAHDILPHYASDYTTTYTAANLGVEEQAGQPPQRDAVLHKAGEEGVDGWSPWVHGADDRDFLTTHNSANTLLDRSLRARARRAERQARAQASAQA